MILYKIELSQFIEIPQHIWYIAAKDLLGAIDALDKELRNRNSNFGSKKSRILSIEILANSDQDSLLEGQLIIDDESTSSTKDPDKHTTEDRFACGDMQPDGSMGMWAGPFDSLEEAKTYLGHSINSFIVAFSSHQDIGSSPAKNVLAFRWDTYALKWFPLGISDHRDYIKSMSS